MAFESKNLSVLAYANNFTLWHYTTTEADVTGAGFFNNASTMLRVGDLMIANLDTDGTPDTQFYVVTGNASGVVAVTAYSAGE
ncbi:MAG: hypothetical protein GC136_00110 [Alphaproteobacteria bacterium]|nr:hypothetical protein [Alphaproteobacteria bacterium]